MFCAIERPVLDLLLPRGSKPYVRLAMSRCPCLLALSMNTVNGYTTPLWCVKASLPGSSTTPSILTFDFTHSKQSRTVSWLLCGVKSKRHHTNFMVSSFFPPKPLRIRYMKSNGLRAAIRPDGSVPKRMSPDSMSERVETRDRTTHVPLSFFVRRISGWVSSRGFV
jgi:hypothetical protein